MHILMVPRPGFECVMWAYLIHGIIQYLNDIRGGGKDISRPMYWCRFTLAKGSFTRAET